MDWKYSPGKTFKHIAHSSVLWWYFCIYWLCMCTCVWVRLPWHMWDSGQLQKAWFFHSTTWIPGITTRVSSFGAIVTLPSEPACHTTTSLRYFLSCELHQLIWCAPLFHFRKDSEILNNQGKCWVCDQLSTEWAPLFLLLCFSMEEKKVTSL